MPILFCSVKLSKLLGVKTRLPSLSLDSWNGHLFTLHRRKCLVFIHKETRYSFVMLDVLKKDLVNFREVFIDAYFEQLRSDDLFSLGLKSFILNDFKNFELSTTDGDKSTIGYLNDCIYRLTWPRGGRLLTFEEVKKYVDNFYNQEPIGIRGDTPKKLMTEKIKEYLKQNK